MERNEPEQLAKSWVEQATAPALGQGQDRPTVMVDGFACERSRRKRDAHTAGGDSREAGDTDRRWWRREERLPAVDRPTTRPGRRTETAAMKQQIKLATGGHIEGRDACRLGIPPMGRDHRTRRET